MELNEKFCSKCETIKLRKEFYLRKASIDGLSHRCIACDKIEAKLWREKNPERAKATTQAWREVNKNRHLDHAASWKRKNRDRFNKITRERYAVRYATDINYKIKVCLRGRLGMALRGSLKASNTTALLGCSIDELRFHLERQFQPGMTWENHGPVWHIDHIKTCASFDLSNPEQQKQCFHYTNLQPLWAVENLKKQKRNG